MRRFLKILIVFIITFNVFMLPICSLGKTLNTSFDKIKINKEVIAKNVEYIDGNYFKKNVS